MSITSHIPVVPSLVHNPVKGRVTYTGWSVDPPDRVEISNRDTAPPLNNPPFSLSPPEEIRHKNGMLAQPRAAPAPAPTPIITQVSAPGQSKSAVGPQPPFAYTTTTTHTVVTTTTTTTQTTTTPARFHELEGASRREDGGVALPQARSAVTVGVVKADNGKSAENGREEEEEGIEEHHLPLPPPITRRNTTGSIQNISSKKKHHAPGKSLTPSAFPPPLQAGFGEGSLDLASDIHKQSEKIRRERNLKRQKHLQQQQLGAEKRVEVGMAAAAAASDTEKEPSPLHPHTSLVPPHISAPASVIATATEAPIPLPDENPLVGNLIGEGHVNYVLMYNMLTGIRIAVSRCGGKIMRPIAEEDFRAEHKYSFDMCVFFEFLFSSVEFVSYFTQNRE